MIRTTSTLLIVLLLVGCGKQEPVKLRVLNYTDSTSPAYSTELERVWEAFEKANPEIILEREDLRGESFFNRLETYITAGDLPDVIYAWPSEQAAGLTAPGITELHAKKLLKDLAPLIKKDKLGMTYSPVALDGALQAGGYLGILPRSIGSSHSFYVNNAVLRDAGLSPAKTYDELKAQVPLLAAKGYDTVIIGNQDGWVMPYCLFSLLAGRFCGPRWEQRILSGEAKFTDEDFIAAISFVQNLYRDAVIPMETLNYSYGDVTRRFATGQSAYLIDSQQRAAALVSPDTNGDTLISAEREEDILLRVFPEIRGVKLNNSTSVIPGPGWGIGAQVASNSAKEKAAWGLVKWLSGKEVQTWLLESGAIMTATRTDIEIDSLPLSLLQKAAAGFAGNYSAGTAVISRTFQSRVNVSLNDGLQELGIGTKSAKQVAEAVQRSFEQP
ncbi:putative sugar ABC transporter [Treponema primitia ZAS-2]|uniref:Putative sugar ABC transporter n=1 Tax=Treponema primitia (strain ATCC BAA-887 / DSM 12427 / ZAS-2) TaxID=545694 RepID=F5YKD3_TREPZ|nr:extracellular solute-binding protein [Treponema primitia]AEF85953.1 putative sugar ABC transporter [Treponema primitia ZAS-2]